MVTWSGVEALLRQCDGNEEHPLWWTYARGMFPPEGALSTLIPQRWIAAAEGVRHTILAPWQAAEPEIDTRRAYRVDPGGGRSIVVAECKHTTAVLPAIHARVY